MLSGPFVFVDVDTQHDFLSPGGALYIAGSEAILPNLARLTSLARVRGIPVIATACAHAEGDPEFEVFPPHCLIGTWGQARVDATAWADGLVVKPDGRFAGEGDILPPYLTIQKVRYDVFSHPDAGRIVSLYAGGHPTFVVYGVATDYCVRAAALGLLERGQKVVLVVDAVRGIDPGREPEVIEELVRHGAETALTEVVCEAAG